MTQPDPESPGDEPIATAEGAEVEDTAAPAPVARHWLLTAGRVGFHAAVAAAMTWPLVSHLGRSIPIGSEPSATVPLFNLWTLRWNADRLAHGLVGYWDAPIFHPESGTFALSDPQPLTGLVAAPLTWLTGDGVLAYGLVLLAVLTLNGVAAARLARRVGAQGGGALVVGVLAQALPFVTHELGVVQLTVLFPVFFALDAVLDWRESGSWPTAYLAGMWLSVSLLTSTYLGLFAVLAVALLLALLADRSWASRLRLAGLIALGAGLLLAVPVMVAQSRLTADHRWADSTIESNSAHAADWRLLDRDMLGATWGPWLGEDGGSGQRLYPGTLLLALGATGLVVARRRGGDRWRIARAFGVTAAACALVSFGLALDVGGWRPYEALQAVVPPLDRLRSPFRFAVMTQVLLVPLAAIAVGRIWEDHRRWVRPGLVGLAALGLAEVLVQPAPLTRVPDVGGEDWAEFLADQDDGAAAAMVPFPDGSSASDFLPTVEAMLAGLDHGHPLVNGYSGFFPDAYDRISTSLAAFPDGGSLDDLEDAGVGWLVVDRRFVSDADLDRVEADPDWAIAFEGEDHTVLQRVTDAP